MAVPREPIFLTVLNDGIEPDFPDTDVPRTDPYGHIGGYMELSDRLSDLCPDKTVIQGPEGSTMADVGLTVDPRVATLQSAHWAPMTKQRSALVARVDFQGAPLSPIVVHRPTDEHPDQRALFDSTLTQVVHSEKDDGQLPLVFIDANEADPMELGEATGLTWYAPFDSSKCGLLLPTRCNVVGVTQLRRTAEHPPVVVLARFPLLNQ